MDVFLYVLLMIVTVNVIFFGILTVIYFSERRKDNDQYKRTNRKI